MLTSIKFNSKFRQKSHGLKENLNCHIFETERHTVESLSLVKYSTYALRYANFFFKKTEQKMFRPNCPLT